MENLSEKQLLAIKEFYDYMDLESLEEDFDDLYHQYLLSDQVLENLKAANLGFNLKYVLKFLKDMEPADKKKARLEKELAELI